MGDAMPPSERGKDEERSEVLRELESGPSRPLTDEEREAAEHDPGRRPRVYAPESERVPKEPAPEDQAVADGVPTHPDSAHLGLSPSDIRNS